MLSEVNSIPYRSTLGSHAEKTVSHEGHSYWVNSYSVKRAHASCGFLDLTAISVLHVLPVHVINQDDLTTIYETPYIRGGG